MAQQTKVEHRRAYALPRADIDRPAQKLDIPHEFSNKQICIDVYIRMYVRTYVRT